MFCLTPAATRVWVRCHQSWFKARCFFPSLTQRYSQVHYRNFFLMTVSIPIMLTHKTGSVVKMEWNRWRIPTGMFPIWVEKTRTWPHGTKKALFKWNKDKKQQQTWEIGRHGWNHKMRGKKKYKQHNTWIKLKCNVSEILNHSWPSGQVLWREKVSFQDTSTRSTTTFHRNDVHAQRDVHEDKSVFTKVCRNPPGGDFTWI